MIASLINSNEKLVNKKKKQISDLINSEITLRSKRELIEKFITIYEEEHEVFDSFGQMKKEKHLIKYVPTRNLEKISFRP